MFRRTILILSMSTFACSSDEALGMECFSIQDCGDGHACFMGVCVPAGFAVSSVLAEITPPNDSPWLVQQVPGLLSLDYGPQDIWLQSSVTLTGKIIADGSPSTGDSLTGVLIARAIDQRIPGHAIVRRAKVASAGYALEVLPGEHSLTFEPSTQQRPPKDFFTDISGTRAQIFPYPSDTTLNSSTLRGEVRYTQSVGTQVEGAEVSGIAPNPYHLDHPFRSTIATTDGSGKFAITFLPEAAGPSITVGPGQNPLVPVVTFSDWLGEFALGVEREVDVRAVIRDTAGNAVSDASIVFDGFSVGDTDGRFVATGSSGPSGSVERQLLPGDYRVTVAPQKEQPYALTTEVQTIPIQNDTLQITVHNKIRLAGTVLSDRGSPVDGAEITLTRRDAPIPRVFSTSTHLDGSYTLDVDPGYIVDEVLHRAEYELIVQPDAQSGLPIYRELIEIWDEDLLHSVRLYEPDFIYGTLRTPTGEPLPNAIMAFYSLELGVAGVPMLVGVVQTNDGTRAGEFVLPVPIP